MSDNGSYVNKPPMPGKLALERDGAGKLWAAEGASGELVLVVARRCFPRTHPDGFVCLIDKQGHDRALIEDARALAEASGQALLAALAHAEFPPRVIRIERVVNEATWSEWHVVMDRGARSLVVE